MSTDVTKLHLKDRLDEQVRHLEEYNAHDLPDHPGWTFLLSSVVKEYGVCPYLDVNDAESKRRRIVWLEEQPDGGELYRETVGKLLNQQWMNDLENDLVSLQQRLREYVRKTIKDLNEESRIAMDAGSCGEMMEGDLPMQIDHDELIESIKLRKEAKSQNKKIKDSWSRTLRMLNYLITKKGLDFSKYVHAVYGWVLRYKPPTDVATNGQLDSQFESLYEMFNSTTHKLSNFKYQLEKEKDDAEQQLANLIKQNFQLEQSGRYFKKWSSLTQEKKEERIKSYCDWYARQHNKPVQMADAMKTFVIEKLESKDLRIMDVKWDSKNGVITDININLEEDDTTWTFSLGKRAPRILKNARKSGKKKKDEIFQTDREIQLMQRINRLLLFEILKGRRLNKDIIVQEVMRNLHTRMLPASHIMDYISSKYEEIVEVIKSNPLPAEREIEVSA